MTARDTLRLSAVAVLFAAALAITLFNWVWRAQRKRAGARGASIVPAASIVLSLAAAAIAPYALLRLLPLLFLVIDPGSHALCRALWRSVTNPK